MKKRFLPEVFRMHGRCWEGYALVALFVALLACGAPKGAQHVNIVRELDKAQGYREVGRLVCERNQPSIDYASNAPKGLERNESACRDELRRNALRLKADVVLIEHQVLGTKECEYCVTIRAIAYQRGDETAGDAGTETATAAPSKPPPSHKKPVQQSGTCFAVGPDGTLITADHVVKDNRAISVAMLGRGFEGAEVLKRSEGDDLAVLKIQSATPEYLSLANTADIQVGDPVFTMGFPVAEWLGVEPKFTDGSVSSVQGPRDADHFMQITVPIQPGNSGGPLLNERGEVVGVVTASTAVTEFFKRTGTLPQGINFSVRVDRVRSILGQPILVGEAPAPASRREVIAKVRPALCAVRVTL